MYIVRARTIHSGYSAVFTSPKLIHDDRWARFRLWIDLPLLALFVVAMTAVFAPPLQDQLVLPEVGSVTQSTVRAQRNLLIEDKDAFAKRRQAARQEIRDVFDYDPEHFLGLGERVRLAVANLDARKKAGTLEAPARRAAFAEELGAPIGSGLFELIEKMKDPETVAVAIRFFLNIGLDRMVVSDRRDLPNICSSRLMLLPLAFLLPQPSFFI